MARITNLQELHAEKYRLEAELQLQKAIIESEVQRLKKKFDVVGRIRALFGMGDGQSFGSAPPALKAGANLGIDLVGHSVLRRAGWITRLVVPLLAKKISSTLLDKFRGRKNRTINR